MPHTTVLTKDNLEECRRVKELYESDKGRLKLTHAQLGKMIGRSPKTVSAIINGKMKVTLEVGRRLSKVFGVPLSDILPWTAALNGDSRISDIVEDISELDEENLSHARRMIRNLLDSQEGV